MIREWKNRLLFLFRRGQFDAGLDEEIRFHLETRAAELVESGVSLHDARLRARREFGRVAASQEGSRNAWQVRWVADFATDFRLSLRSFRRSPVFAATAIVSLALGIGGTAAIFSMMDAALWRPLPVREPERLVRLGVERRPAGVQAIVPAPVLPALRDLAAFDGILTTSADGVSLDVDGRAERIVAQAVSRNYFEVLGVRPHVGRHFSSQGPWAPEVTLSYRFWQRRFGGNASAIGRTVRLNSRPFTIVGVSPPSFLGVERGRDYELQFPVPPVGVLLDELALVRGSSEKWITAMARLRPGFTASAAEAAMNGPLVDFARTTSLPRFRNVGIERARLLPGDRGWTEKDMKSFETPLLTLLALVGLVLLIACANVAGMLLARAAARERELALRCSIGAGRGRLARQMLAESVALSALGGLAGLAIAGPVGRLLFGFLPQGHVGMAVDVRADGRVALFAIAATLVTGVIFGLAPALLGTRGDLAARLKSGGQSRSSSRARSVLVAAQAAFAAALLIATGSLAQSLVKLRPGELAPNPERLMLFTMKPPPELYSETRTGALFAEMVRRVAALPGVTVASIAQDGPLSSRGGTIPLKLSDGSTLETEFDVASPRFFETIGIRRVAGRDFTASDRAGGTRVAIVNQTLARALFGNANPIGRTFPISFRETIPHEVVGVVSDVHYYDVHQAPRPGLWLPAEQGGLYMPTLFVRWTNGGTGAAVESVRRTIETVDAGFPVFNVWSFESRIREALARDRMLAQFSAALGGLALLMAAVGVYGLLAFAVTRRTREIGIRMALGSRAEAVVWLVAREGLRPVLCGLAAGSFVAVLARAGWLPLTGAIAALLIAAIAAAAIPALRASRIDPLRALRVD